MRPEVPLGPASGDQVRAACSGATFFGGGSNVPASPTLYVFGKLNGSLNLNAGGSLYDADASTPGVNYNGGGKHYTALPNPLADYTAPLTDLSAQLADLTATAGTSFVNGKFKPARTRASWCSRSRARSSQATS